MEFMGYVRPDGKVGARNYVAVIPSVTCANDVANAICHQVQGTITYLHHQGCCQMPPDLERVTDTLISLGMSPNVGAILIVSLGCEGTDHERMYKELSATGKHVEIIHIQELGGVSKAIQLGTDIARKLVIEISGLQRQPVDVSKIVMAIKCGASDTTSGMASNCVIGYVADKLVDLGATVIFGETTEFLYASGAKEVHIRPACPPLLFGCKYLNFSRSTSEMELITRRVIKELEGCDPDRATLEEYADPDSEKYRKMVEKIGEKLHFTSLHYHRLDDMMESVGIDADCLCTYCWNGKE